MPKKKISDIKEETYLSVIDRENPMAIKCGRVLIHRMLMSKKLGRVLRPEEIVHHINHNNKDNRIENLQLMTISEHMRHHKLYHKTEDGVVRITHCKNGHIKSVENTYASGGCIPCIRSKYKKKFIESK